MSTATYVLGIVAAVVALLAVVELLRRRRLRERHAIWWFVAAILALVVAIFPSTLTSVASWLGFGLPSNLAFFFSIVILFLVNLQHSAELTELEDKTRTLAEHSALLSLRLERLEADRDSSGDESGTPQRPSSP